MNSTYAGKTNLEPEQTKAAPDEPASQSSQPATAVVQRKESVPRVTSVFQPDSNPTGLPDGLKSGLENLSGLCMDDIRVHYRSSKPSAVNALAYTKGNDIHLSPGQEQHLAHEAWHAVQQKQGRVKPTLQLKSFSLNDDSGLEREADVMGARAAHGLPKTASAPVKQASLKTTPVVSSANGVVQGKYIHSDGKPWDEGLIRWIAEGYLKSFDLTWKQKKKLIDRAIRGPINTSNGKDWVVGDQNNLNKQIQGYIDQGIKKGVHNRPEKPFIPPPLRASTTKTAKAHAAKKNAAGRIKAKSVEDAFSKFTNFLDYAVGEPGSQISFEFGVEFGAGVVGGILLSGTAGRGIDGFATGGYPRIAGNPKHLEMALTVTGKIGFGVNIGIAKADASILPKVFIRAGADNTKAAVNALSYGWYRFLVNAGQNPKRLANRIYGGKNADSKTAEAEKWAQMVEKSAFKEAGAFSDVGGGLGFGAETETAFGGVSASVGLEAFKRYDIEALNESLGMEGIGMSINSKDIAKKRREKAASRSVGSFTIQCGANVKSGSFSGAFSGSWSGEFERGQGFKDVMKSTGLVLTGEVSGGNGQLNETNLVHLIAEVIKQIIKITEKTGKKVKNPTVRSALQTFRDRIKGADAVGKTIPKTNKKLISFIKSIAEVSFILSVAVGYDKDKGLLLRVDLQRAAKVGLPETVSTVVKLEAKKAERIISFVWENGWKQTKSPNVLVGGSNK